MTYNVLISDPLSEEGLKPLREAEGIDIEIDTGLAPEELAEKIDKYDALLVRSQTKVTRDIIEKAANLKIIGRAGVGVDNIDLDAATENGIIVVNAPNGNTNSAAEHTMAMMMALSRNIPQAYHSLKNQKWDRKKYTGVELRNKTLGIVGLGRIGTEVASRAMGSRMNIVAYDPFLTEERAEKMGIGYGTFEEVIKQADFITVHTPLVKDTKHIINQEAFSKMKDGVQIVNCARGGIIDEDALYDAIQSKKVHGAALDVMEEEPFMDHKLLELDEVIATPHLGASTVEAQEMVAVDVGHDVINYFTNGTVKNPVNLSSVSSEVMASIQPYIQLAEKIGTFLTDFTQEAAEQINISYAGSLYDMEVGLLTRNAVKGVLARHLGTQVNDVNAMYLAEKKDIVINENKTQTSKDFNNLMTVEVKAKSGTRKVSGTLLGGIGPRIVRLGDYAVDFTPKGHLVIIKHIDKPGVIGAVGSVLAEHDINVATMQVDRTNVGGDAIMVLTVDKHLNDACTQALKDVDVIKNAIPIDM